MPKDKVMKSSRTGFQLNDCHGDRGGQTREGNNNEGQCSLWGGYSTEKR